MQFQVQQRRLNNISFTNDHEVQKNALLCDISAISTITSTSLMCLKLFFARSPFSLNFKSYDINNCIVSVSYNRRTDRKILAAKEQYKFFPVLMT